VEDEAAAPVGPQKYTIDIDVPSPEGKGVQSATFLPINVQVRPGDTIVFENRSTEAPHTVTFGTKDALTPDAPKPVTKAGQANPLIFMPCYSAAVPAPDAEACPETAPATPPAYAGTGYWNSGLMAPASAPAGAHSVTMTLAPEIAPGTYAYSCMLHPNMSGLIDVVPTDEERQTPEVVAKKATRQRNAVLDAAAHLAEPVPAAGAPAVTAGWGDQTTSVNRFSPAVINIKTGQTVTWKVASPGEAHTVTFESPFKSPEDAGVFTPGGMKSGGRYAAGFAHSGLMGAQPFPTDTFSLTFTKAGTYTYNCVLHPGMIGQVVVG
jgi:plastocyanin